MIGSDQRRAGNREWPQFGGDPWGPFSLRFMQRVHPWLRRSDQALLTYLMARWWESGHLETVVSFNEIAAAINFHRNTAERAVYAMRTCGVIERSARRGPGGRWGYQIAFAHLRNVTKAAAREAIAMSRALSPQELAKASAEEEGGPVEPGQCQGGGGGTAAPGEGEQQAKPEAEAAELSSALACAAAWDLAMPPPSAPPVKLAWYTSRRAIHFRIGPSPLAQTGPTDVANKGTSAQVSTPVGVTSDATWEQIKSELRNSIAAEAFDIWLARTGGTYDADARTLELRPATEFHVEQLREYEPLVRSAALATLGGDELTIRYVPRAIAADAPPPPPLDPGPQAAIRTLLERRAVLFDEPISEAAVQDLVSVGGEVRDWVARLAAHLAKVREPETLEKRHNLGLPLLMLAKMRVAGLSRRALSLLVRAINTELSERERYERYQHA